MLLRDEGSGSNVYITNYLGHAPQIPLLPLHHLEHAYDWPGPPYKSGQAAAPSLKGIVQCAADFSLLNLPKGKSLGRSKPATNS